jgi:nucleoside-diphosphate-sugar epimerase
MSVLVTGAAGFIGSSLSDALTRRGDDVIGLDCFTDYYARDIKESNLAPLRGCWKPSSPVP